VLHAEQRNVGCADRRRVPRGGRRATDRPGRFPRIVVADSFAGARIPYARYLRELAFHVDEAENGGQLLSVIDREVPHLVIMERDLPQWPAWTLATWLELNARTEHVPIIVLASDTHRASTFEPPQVAGVLRKPFRLGAMIEEIRQVLRRSPNLFVERQE
jgi:DNA-binding response OmpR family regulator